ncbi:MAG: type II toxin-antitoxin system HicB family antitoxin [Acidimicrobiales bacterium]
MRLTAAITQEGPWWVARCLEVEVTSQGESLEEARANLSEALALYFEDQPEALADAQAPIITAVDVDVAS